MRCILGAVLGTVFYMDGIPPQLRAIAIQAELFSVSASSVF